MNPLPFPSRRLSPMVTNARGTNHRDSEGDHRSHGNTQMSRPAAMELPQTTTLPARDDPTGGVTINSTIRISRLEKSQRPPAIFITTWVGNAPSAVTLSPPRFHMPLYRHFCHSD